MSQDALSVHSNPPAKPETPVDRAWAEVELDLVTIMASTSNSAPTEPQALTATTQGRYGDLTQRGPSVSSQYDAEEYVSDLAQVLLPLWTINYA